MPKSDGRVEGEKDGYEDDGRNVEDRSKKVERIESSLDFHGELADWSRDRLHSVARSDVQRVRAADATTHQRTLIDTTFSHCCV